MWTVEPLLVTPEERVELERRVRALTTAHRDRQRAEVVLLAADGVPGAQIAPRVGLSAQSVSKWRCQFRDRGLGGLVDAPRSGRRRARRLILRPGTPPSMVYDQITCRTLSAIWRRTAPIPERL